MYSLSLVSIRQGTQGTKKITGADADTINTALASLSWDFKLTKTECSMLANNKTLPSKAETPLMEAQKGLRQVSD